MIFVVNAILIVAAALALLLLIMIIWADVELYLRKKRRKKPLCMNCEWRTRMHNCCQMDD